MSAELSWVLGLYASSLKIQEYESSMTMAISTWGWSAGTVFVLRKMYKYFWYLDHTQ